MRCRVLLLLPFVCAAAATAAPPDPNARLQKLIAQRAEAVVAEGTRLILGYGEAGALDAAGLARAIAHERAALREAARAMLLRADLDGDGAVGAAERALHENTLSARMRAQMRTAFDQADADRDGTASSAEISAHAARVGLEKFDETDAADLRAYLELDQDGDGRLTVEELSRAVAERLRALRAAPKPAKAL